MRYLWPDRELFIKTEQRVDHEHGESFIDLAVVWVEQCVNGPEARVGATVGATVEIKVESTFSDTVLDALRHVHRRPDSVHICLVQRIKRRIAKGGFDLDFHSRTNAGLGAVDALFDPYHSQVNE